MDKKATLRQYWGYNDFRPLQEDIIQSVLDGYDTLALMPTGGGKSLCFQVPGLMMEGVCLVISPLIALMKDQVENLKLRKIKAFAVHSGMSREEIDLALNNCMFNEGKFLYISPERLETDNFRQIINKLKINLIAVDEAHCISQWGYDFRPPYLKIAAIRSLLPGVPVLALTATATSEVVNDIQLRLHFRNGKVFRKSFERKNLAYLVIHDENKQGRLLNICNRVKGPGVIYVNRRKKTKDIAEFLNKNHIPAGYYHGGLDPKLRNQKQNDWMTGKTRIIVATNAFGMGIDKPDVRFVVHLDIPDTLEAYFQEAGRAGRDEKKSFAVMLCQKSDETDAVARYQMAYPPVETIRNVYLALGNYYQIAVGSGKNLSFDFDFDDFCRQYRLKPSIAYNSLKFVEKEGYLYLDEDLSSPPRIHFKMSRNDLYRFQVENAALDDFIKLLLRSYSGVFQDFVRIAESDIAVRSGLSEPDVIKCLRFLDKSKVLTYIPRKSQPKMVFLFDRIDEKDLIISPENYSERKKTAFSKLQSILKYVKTSNRCRSNMLLNYFSDTTSRRCGICDYCLRRNKLGISDLEFNSILQKIKPELLLQNLTLDEIMNLSSPANPEKVLAVLRWLVDNQKIVLNPGEVYSWNRM